MIFDFENIRLYVGFHMTGSGFDLDFTPWVRLKKWPKVDGR